MEEFNQGYDLLLQAKNDMLRGGHGLWNVCSDRLLLEPKQWLDSHGVPYWYGRHYRKIGVPLVDRDRTLNTRTIPCSRHLYTGNSR